MKEMKIKMRKKYQLDCEKIILKEKTMFSVVLFYRQSGKPINESY